MFVMKTNELNLENVVRFSSFLHLFIFCEHAFTIPFLRYQMFFPETPRELGNHPLNFLNFQDWITSWGSSPPTAPLNGSLHRASTSYVLTIP